MTQRVGTDTGQAGKLSGPQRIARHDIIINPRIGSRIESLYYIGKLSVNEDMVIS
jgi:hypothetical protein